MREDETLESPLHALRPVPDAPEQQLALSEGSLQQIFEEHSRRMLRAAVRITGNASDAEDVLQTIFLRLARREHNLGPTESLGPYLHRAAVNAAFDLVRSRKRARAVPIDEAEPEADPAIDAAPAERHERRELRETIRTALAHLPPRAAEICALRYLEGVSNKDIAHQLGTTQTAVGVALHRARGQLREHLAAWLGEAS